MVTKSQEQEPGQTLSVAEAEGDDWSWMVDEDPAFVLEQCDGT